LPDLKGEIINPLGDSSDSGILSLLAGAIHSTVSIPKRGGSKSFDGDKGKSHICPVANATPGG
jgi:hypothetical protein